MASDETHTKLETRTRGKTIGQRMSLLLALTVFLAVAVVTAIFAFSDISSDFASRKRSLEATGYVFASAIADHMDKHDSQESLRVLRSISRIPEITYAAVVDRDGKAFASFGSAVMLDSAALTADVGLLRALETGTYPVVVDIIKSGKNIGRVFLIADISDLRQQLLEVLLTSFVVAFLAIATSYSIARKMLGKITGPILSLVDAFHTIRTTRNYETKVDHQADDETGLLVDSFNSMIMEIRARDVALERHRQTLESTVEQRTQELRHARDAAESANDAKSNFLATMSHEIRTPLNGLMVMAELLAGAGLDQRLQRYAEVIVNSGQSLLTIINDILDLSKIEAGKLQLESIPVNPARIADDVTSLFWEKASSKGLDLATRVAPNVPALIHGDPVRLNQILSNLVNNALKFTESGQVLISLSREDGRLVLAVSDSGIGIPQKKLDLLFEAFSQADQTITRKFGGTGLGLAICKRLAEAMGGTIGVHSQIGRGSTFWVNIPVAEVAGHSMPAARAHGLRAAIAIDGLASQSALGTALAAAGFRVSIVTDGTHGEDVVFVAANRHKSLRHEPGRRPKVICVGWIGDTEGEAAIADGTADDLILLPLRHQDITEMIGRILAGALRGRTLLERHMRPEKQLQSFKGRRVLVADDNAVNREVIIEVLRQLDIALLVAVNGKEAVEMWLKHKPDLVFMDCSMPEMDGYSATREIRAHEALAIAGRHTPVIALTAHVAGTDSETWRHAGMDAYMTKPFTLNQIVDCLNVQFTGMPVDMLTMQGEGSPADDREILDGAILDELRNIGGNTALFNRVLDLFASRVPQAVEKVTTLATGSDLDALADAAHALKSMCANIGAHHAVGACHDLELAARTSKEFDAGEKTASIIREVHRVMRAVDGLRAA